MPSATRLPIILLVAALLGLAPTAWAVPDFTFLHLSDPHIPHAAAQTRETVAALPTSEAINLQPYGVTVPAPAFAIVTGDLTEFGGGNGWGEQYEALWSALPFRVHHQLGNHDNTWYCGRPALRRLHGGPFYAFERFGVKFIGWDSATPQDPRPSVATEGLLWLRDELEGTPPEQPIVFFCHHAPDGREFAGDYERARLLDLLHTRNVALLLVGHGHGARAWDVAGFDTVMGGSTYGDRRGYGIVSIQDDVLRVCHQYVGDEPRMIALLEKPLPGRSPFLNVAAISPADGQVFQGGDAIQWTIQVEPPESVQRARWLLDEEADAGSLALEDGEWTGSVRTAGLAPGAHTLRFELLDTEERLTSRTVAFWMEGGPFRIAWKQQLEGSCQSTPVVAQGRLYVGGNGGGLYALDAATGERLWRYPTGGEVRSRPALAEGDDAVYFGSAEGSVYAVMRDGTPKWRFEAGSPIYASPRISGNAVVCGTNGGEVLALDRGSGSLLWRSAFPEYAIETAPCVGDFTVYAGAWDRFVYSLDIRDGARLWRAPSRGSDREGGVARYYSPADCGPVFVEGRVFVADRAYYLTVLDSRTGERLMEEKQCVAVSPSGDGRSVYVRHTDGRVSKRRSDGRLVWTAEAPTGSIATPPVEAHGYVWVLSSLGTLSALHAETGEVAAEYKAFPDVYAFAAPAFDGERVYVADMAGDLLALEPTWPR
ncbi:MAG: PQQ-binding-like beta-propeller repeat protein [Armatimonadota bacterium]